MKKFSELADDNGTTLKTYVEMMQEKAADHGWISLSLFLNPDDPDPSTGYHVISNSEVFINIMAGYLLYVKQAQNVPGPEKIGVVKPGK